MAALVLQWYRFFLGAAADPVHSCTYLSFLHQHSCCFSKRGVCWPPSAVGNTLTMEKYNNPLFTTTLFVIQLYVNKAHTKTFSDLLKIQWKEMLWIMKVKGGEMRQERRTSFQFWDQCVMWKIPLISTCDSNKTDLISATERISKYKRNIPAQEEMNWCPQ